MGKRVTLLGNPIYRGYPWEQAMTLSAGAVPGGLRADFRTEAEAVPVTVPTITLNGSTYAIELTGSQTEAIIGDATEGVVRADVVLSGVPLGLQLVVPVATLTTEA